MTISIFSRNTIPSQRILRNFFVTFGLMLAGYALPTSAQTLPSNADPGRIDPLQRLEIPDKPPAKIITPSFQPDLAIPDAAKEVTFILKEVKLEGATAFTQEELSELYKVDLNTTITLEYIWLLAGKITQKYQNAGYFISRAYVPQQEINEGVVTIRIVEGFIGQIELDDAQLAKHSLVQKLFGRIENKKPINAYELESFILQINALPGKEFRAVLEPAENSEAGKVILSLQTKEEEAVASISFDNFGSRFLGPYQATATYSDSLLPLQQTTVSALSTTPADEMQYFALRHSAPVHPDIEVELNANYVSASPGAALESSDISSNAIELGIALKWQPIRLRQENLITSIELNGQNTNGDIFNDTPLTRDRIRAARGRISYDTTDAWNGYNYLFFELSKGLGIFGASEQGDLNLSRAGAEPDFTTAQFDYIRQQVLPENFVAIGQFSGQLASGPLFSAEEFGYGGQSIGKAYDPSEITGDHGLAASLELRYLGLTPWLDIEYTPFAFYDIGKVWNEGLGGIDESGSSAGLGVRFSYGTSFSGVLGLAWPLTRDIGTPIYGDSQDPRTLFQVNYGI